MRNLLSIASLVLGLSLTACLVEDVRLCGSDDNPTCTDATVTLDGGNDAGEEVDSGPADGGMDAAVDAGPCGGGCPGEKPFCDSERGECVACLSSATCADAERPVCIEGECAPCTEHDQCEAKGSAFPACGDDGTCVRCTPDTEEVHCGADACDPLELECTGTPRGTVGTCEPCRSDAECIDAHRCVPLTHMGSPRGYYCMPAQPCTNRPWVVPLLARESRSGADAATYCGVNEAHTTCEAVLFVIEEGGTCANHSDCPDGGRCELVVGDAKRCTYTCGNAEQCPPSMPFDTCRNATERYCGQP